MIPEYPTLCDLCKHRLDIGSCAAFASIPGGILTRGYQIHLEPLPGDNGIRYARADAEQLKLLGYSEADAKIIEGFWANVMEGHL